MKKFVSLLLAVVMCMLLVACGNGSYSSEPSEKTKPSLDVTQEVVDICCNYSRCRSIKGLEIGTQHKYETEDGWKVTAKGSYYPVDEYGEIEDKMLFDIEFTATWDGNSSFYDIDVDRQDIKRKY